jgi:long-subunit acyl-CoA synthetase (AMP-forming)
MPLLEVFGMSESCGAIAVSGPNDLARPLDACGAALPGGSLEILPDGEVCWRGANNFKGYKGMLKATAEALEVEGGSWKSNTGNSGATTTTTTTTLLHTGDLGVVDPATGYLRITGRKKDLIITAGGENVAPSPIEQAFVDLLRGAAAHAILVGEGRKFLVVLLAPPEDATAEDATPPLDEAAIRSAVEAYNRSYAKSRAQRVQMAAALPAFSVAGGELTPTMKVKRAAVVERSADLVEAMYSGEVATRAAALAGYTSIVL